MKKIFLLSLITFYVQAQTLYFNNYDSLGKNDKVVTNATFEGLATTGALDSAVSSLVPTNRTITVGSQVGSLESNLVFASTGTGDITKLYNPSNGNAWAEIKGDSVYVYAPGPSVTFSSDFGSIFFSGDERAKGKTFKHPAYFPTDELNPSEIYYYSQNNEYIIQDGGFVAGLFLWDGTNKWVANEYYSVGFATYNPTGTIYETVYSLESVSSDTNKVDKITTLTINGQTWTLSSNGVFVVKGDYVALNNGVATNLSARVSFSLFDKPVSFSSDYGTFGFYLDNGYTNYLHEISFLAKNKSSFPIFSKKIVYFKNGDGLLTGIDYASQTNADMKSIGIVSQPTTIGISSSGYVSSFSPSIALSVPLSAYQANDDLWLSIGGLYTNVEPQNVAAKWHLGHVISVTGTTAYAYFDPRRVLNNSDVSAVAISSGTATNLSVFSSLTLLDHIITWNFDRQTFDVPLFGGVTGQLFQEQLLLVRNQTGANIANGKIVCSAGAVGDNSAIRKASSSDASCAWGVLGMVTQDAGIDHGSNGLICTSGEVNNLPLPTSIYQPSNTLWLTTDGNYTNVEPQNVAVKYQIGIVLRAHATEGRIQFHPQFIPSPASIGAASASNATLTGTATINGDVIIGASAVTNAILANQQLIAPTIVKDVVISTNVVRVTSTQSVYVATVASPCVITQDVSSLSLATNQTAFWTTRINVTDWNATNGITFATNIAAYAGDFTVTGCYDFACSLLCDGRIEMRQTFPTVYEWKHMFGSSIGSATNAAAVFYTYPKEEVLFIGLAHIKTSILAGYVYSIYYPAFTKYPGSSSPTDIKVYTNSADTTDISIPYAAIFTRNDYLVNQNVNSYGFSIRKLGTSDTSSHSCWQYMREANELEIRAYNNGWRP